MMPVFVVTPGDVIAIGAVLALLVGLGVAAALKSWKQWRCKHSGGVRETRSCDAICRQCGKNLGFIGATRKGNP